MNSWDSDKDFKFTPCTSVSPHINEENHRWCIFAANDVVVFEGGLVLADHVRQEFFPQLSQTILLGETEDTAYWYGVADRVEHEKLHWQNPRGLIGRLSIEEFEIFSRAIQLGHWEESHRFCSRCGSPARMHHIERMMECTTCLYQQYPRISPCIIVLVHYEGKMLLARNSQFPRGLYSTLAGFIEAGESAEHALHREVKEEVGIEVKNLRYVQSQSWPFPHSLMLGFHAEYAGGDIQVDNVEITDAVWWDCDDLPSIPPKGTISRSLIDDFLDNR